MNMYIAQVNNGHLDVVRNLGVIDPQEGNVPRPAEFAKLSAAG